MITDQTASSGRRRSVRARGIRVLASLVVLGAVMCASITPAGAGGAPAPTVPSDSTSQAGADERGAASGLNVGALLTLVGLGLAICVPIAGRARIARERSVRRFRAQLRSADLPAICERRTTTGQGPADVKDPPSPGSSVR